MNVNLLYILYDISFLCTSQSQTAEYMAFFDDISSLQGQNVSCLIVHLIPVVYLKCEANMKNRKSFISNMRQHAWQ